MSRGPGRWQRLLLHELYHNPRPPGLLTTMPSIHTRKLAANDSEYSAIRRAARKLVSEGLADYAYGGYAHTLVQVTPAPEIDCPTCGAKCCEQRATVQLATLKAVAG